jgi:hypothetical protein
MPQNDHDVTVKERLHSLDDQTVACRGDHHDWPVLQPGRLPEGISARPQADGCYQIRVTCRNCGRVRVKTTLPRGLYDGSAAWRYEGGPKDFREPPGMGMSRADYTTELWHRMSETIRTGAKS